jgi:hypothetical protein
MTEAPPDAWDSRESKAEHRPGQGAEGAGGKGGLRFGTYLPPNLAGWLLDLIERGVFTDPSEAVFVILGEHRDAANC